MPEPSPPRDEGPVKGSAEWLNGLSDEERRSVLAGDFGTRMYKWAMSHVTYICWAVPAAEGPGVELRSGSAFFLDTGTGLLAITAGHVYREYLEARQRFGTVSCKINEAPFDPATALVACRYDPADSQTPDIATFRFDYDRLMGIHKQALRCDPWPPPPPAVGQTVYICGLPASVRVWSSPHEVEFGLYGGSTPVTSISDHQITCRFDRGCWVDSLGKGLPPAGLDLGGISGGPMLVPWWRDNAWEWQLGGVISQAHSGTDYETVIAVRSHFILSDGSISRT